MKPNALIDVGFRGLNPTYKKRCYFILIPRLIQFNRLKFSRYTVANIKSAIKRVQIAERNRLQNKSYKSAVKTLMKKYFAAVSSYAASPSPESMEAVQTTMASAYSKIDKAVKRGVLHANTGARKKARLAKAMKQHEAPAKTAS